MKMAPTLPPSLRFFPWFTLGRREEATVFLKKCQEQAERVRYLKEAPTFSLIIPLCGKVREGLFQRNLDALSLQAYSHWECLVVGDKKNYEALLRRLPQDARFRWVESPANEEAGLCNAGAAASKGDWLGVLEPEATLSPAALFQLATEAQAQAADIFYTNELWVGANGRDIVRTLHKADPSTFNLLHFNPIGRFWAIRKATFADLGGFDEATAPFHEHALFLKASRNNKRFSLIPHFLYYRCELSQGDSDRVRPGLSKIIQAHLDEIGFEATAKEYTSLPSVKVSPRVPSAEDALVSAIVCFRNHAADTVRALLALERRVGTIPVEVLVVDNCSDAEETALVESALQKIKLPSKLIRHNEPFNFARMHNQVIREVARGDFILFLNNDVFWEKTGTLDTLVAWAARPEIGTVGITLRYPNGALQHGGLCAIFGGETRLVRVGNQQNEDLFTREAREVFANSFAAAMVHRNCFNEVGGLRELDLPNGFGDLSFNFDCLKNGRHNINLGFIEAVHAESASRGAPYEFWEENIVEREYPDLLQQMLRRDLGFGRSLGASTGRVLMETFGRELSQKFPRLGQWKSGIKQLIRTLQTSSA